MKAVPTDIPGLVILEPCVFEDERGFLLEIFKHSAFQELGLPSHFVQINRSRSRRNVVRGLHYQIQRPQGKVVSVLAGEIFDVAVDLRCTSQTFGRWSSVNLSATNCRQLYIPAGMAHGFCVISEFAEVIYQCTDAYSPQHERTIRWNDPQLAITWPIDQPILSSKDANGVLFRDAEYY